MSGVLQFMSASNTHVPPMIVMNPIKKNTVMRYPARSVTVR